MTVVNWALAAAGLPVLVAALYLLSLTLLWRRPGASRPGGADRMFVVLVPAHNEQGGIAATIRSLKALHYPKSQRRIVVVADNCTDRTADIATSEGAEVLVRQDGALRGKGYALQFGIDHLLATASLRPWDALVVVDADTTVSPNLLRALASRFDEGAEAVQAAYLPRRSGDAEVSIITHIAFVAFHLVRSVARERLGLSCGLRGNGMAFSRDLLARVPHHAFSRTEDLEFGVQLGLRGVRVAFAADALVNGEMPERQEAVAQQRTRWIGGRVALAHRFVPTLLREAARRRSPMLVDLAADLLVPPVSVLAVAAVFGLEASVVLAAVIGQVTVTTIVWALALGALLIHVVHAAHVAGRARALLPLAWSLPGYALDKTLIALTALRPSEERWVRTLREGEKS